MESEPFRVQLLPLFIDERCSRICCSRAVRNWLGWCNNRAGWT